jgi:glycosyltransferase involved in cell wall biosynthesis
VRSSPEPSRIASPDRVFIPQTMARICIVTAGHISSNPRVWKEADALSAAGHEVVVIGTFYDPAQAYLDAKMVIGRAWRHHVAADLTGKAVSRRVMRGWYRLRSRIARSLICRGIHDPHALAYAVDRLLNAALRERADLTIVHLEAGLWVGWCLAKRGRRVGVDFEDWHSENDTAGQATAPQRRFYRELERKVANVAGHVSTTSKAMSERLSTELGIAPPLVIYNGVKTSAPGSPPKDLATMRLLWFSQTIGAGRGLEDLFAALPLICGEWELHLVGKAGIETINWVFNAIPERLHRRVRILPPVSPDELSALVSTYDIGLALERPDCENKDLTISNKILQYLQCGLTVVATDTAGQREVMDTIKDAGAVYSSGDVTRLAAILTSLLVDPKPLCDARGEISAAATAVFGYETAVPALLRSVNRALSC